MFLSPATFFFFFFNDTATTEIYTLSLHDALPISNSPYSCLLQTTYLDLLLQAFLRRCRKAKAHCHLWLGRLPPQKVLERDRKSTRLNSSHSQISYAVFCLKKKTTNTHSVRPYTRP